MWAWVQACILYTCLLKLGCHCQNIVAYLTGGHEFKRWICLMYALFVSFARGIEMNMALGRKTRTQHHAVTVCSISSAQICLVQLSAESACFVVRNVALTPAWADISWNQHWYQNSGRRYFPPTRVTILYQPDVWPCVHDVHPVFMHVSLRWSRNVLVCLDLEVLNGLWWRLWQSFLLHKLRWCRWRVLVLMLASLLDPALVCLRILNS